MGKINAIGLILASLGILLLFFSFILSPDSNIKANVKGAGGFFVGPIPIFGFASDKKMLYVLFAVGIALFVLSYFMTKIF